MTKRLAMLSTLLLVACGQSGPSNAGNEVASGPEGDSGNGAAPAAVDVPDFPGSTSVEIPNLGVPGTDSRSGNSIARETDVAPDQVAQFYREHFRKVGMPVRLDTAGASGGLMGVGRDGERGAMLAISRIGEKTRIAATRSPGPR